MTLWSDIAPILAKAGTEVAKEALIAGIQSRRYAPEPVALPLVVPDLAEDHGCPFCQITRHLAAAYRYLRRGLTRPALATIYGHLAMREIDAAVEVLTDAGGVPASERARLGQTLVRIQAEIGRPNATLTPALAEAVWRASEVSLDLAEYVNVPPPRASLGDVVEGEYRVITSEEAQP